MKKYFMMSLVALVAMTMTSCLHVKVGDKDWSLGGSHTNDTPTQVHEVGQETAMQPFDEVNVIGPFNVIYEQSETNSVRVEGTAEQLEKMTIYVKDSDLYIDHRKQESGNTFKGLRVFVTSTAIKGVDVIGSGSLTVPKALNADDFSISLAGSGEATIAQLNCTDLDIEIAGSGDVTTGTIQATKVKNEVAGSGDINIAGLTCKNLNNQIAGSGNIVLNNLNVDEVKSEIAGSGEVTLNGHVGSHKENIMGSGKVHLEGLK